MPPVLRRRRLFHNPPVHPDPPWRMRCHFKESGFPRVALQLLVDLCWSLATAFAKTLLHGVYLSDLSLNRQPIAAHRKKMCPPYREVAFGWAAGILVFLRVWSLKPALAALQLGSTHPGVVRRGQASWGWVDEVDSEVAYRFNKTQIYVTQGPKESLEVPSAIRSLFIQQAVLTPGPGWGGGEDGLWSVKETRGFVRQNEDWHALMRRISSCGTSFAQMLRHIPIFGTAATSIGWVIRWIKPYFLGKPCHEIVLLFS